METIEIQKKWEQEQLDLKKKLITIDDLDFILDSEEKPLKLIGGVDISFGKENDAVASLVVLSYPELKVVFELYKKVTMDQPYIAGFLAFREVGFLVDLIEIVRKDKPEYVPQVIMVDGSGIHHPRGFGLASHLGVLTGIPTIGMAKKLLAIDGIDRDKIKNIKEEMEGDSYSLLKGDSGVIHGAVKGNKNVVYVSIGHKISLETCLAITKKTCLFKNPEPVRKADLLSREFIREETKNLNENL